MVDKYFSTLAILVIPCASCLMMYIECDIFHFHSMCLDGIQAGPLQAWSDPERSRKLMFPDFMTTAQDGGKVVSSTHWPPLLSGNTPGIHFF